MKKESLLLQELPYAGTIAVCVEELSNIPKQGEGETHGAYWTRLRDATTHVICRAGREYYERTGTRPLAVLVSAGLYVSLHVHEIDAMPILPVADTFLHGGSPLYLVVDRLRS